jgi:hypothetical protein
MTRCFNYFPYGHDSEQWTVDVAWSRIRLIIHSLRVHFENTTSHTRCKVATDIYYKATFPPKGKGNEVGRRETCPFSSAEALQTVHRMNVTVKQAWRQRSGQTSVTGTSTAWMKQQHEPWAYLPKLRSTYVFRIVIYCTEHNILSTYLNSTAHGLTFHTKTFTEVFTPRMTGAGKSKFSSTNSPLLMHRTVHPGHRKCRNVYATSRHLGWGNCIPQEIEVLNCVSLVRILLRSMPVLSNDGRDPIPHPVSSAAHKKMTEKP